MLRQHLHLVRGDDYLDKDGLALKWNQVESVHWPDLTEATITFTLKSTAFFHKAGTVTAPGGGAQQVMVELLATETNLFRPDTYRYDVQALLAQGDSDQADTITLAAGTCTVLSDVTV